MTLEELNEHLYVMQQYQAAVDRIESMTAVMLGAQKLDGMPHGTSVGDKTAALAIAIAEQKKDLESLKRAAEASMSQVKAYCESIQDRLVKVIFRLRYVGGMTWAEVAISIGGGNNRDTVRQTVYRYLKAHENDHR